MNQGWQPPRIVQIFDSASQAVYKSWTAKDKLEWLESINRLYWESRQQDNNSSSLGGKKPSSSK